MGVDTSFDFESLFNNLKLEDPWIPPTTWESIPSQSGRIPASLSQPLSLSSSISVSEASLVRLSMNALQGVQSALISVEKISAVFCSNPADRTFHRIHTLWNRSSSTDALGKMLKSIGRLGFLVFLLHKFIHHFSNLDETVECQNHNDTKVQEEGGCRNSLVNQAFAVSVRKVLEGYMCALDTLHVSIVLRCSSKEVEEQLNEPPPVGCIMSGVHSKITLLEMYLHIKELRTHIEALGNVCNLYDVAHSFSSSTFADLVDKATFLIRSFFRGGDLLTYLYSQLQVADPAHYALLKFLFLRSCEPYCGFIRSWIYKAEISDPYEEFVVECVDDPSPYQSKERRGVAVPCFLKDLLGPLVRVGQQLQVLVKLLELCTYGNHTYEDLLPCWSGFSCNHSSHEFAITFSKEDIEARVLARDNYYKSMLGELDNLLRKLEFRYQKVVPHDAVHIVVGENSDAPLSVTLDDSLCASSLTEKRHSNMVGGNVDFDESSTIDDIDCAVDIYDLSESSSSDGSEEQIEIEQMTDHSHMAGLKQDLFSVLSFSKISSENNSLQKPLQCEDPCHVNCFHGNCKIPHALGHFPHPHNEDMILCDASFLFKTGDSNQSLNSDFRSTASVELHSSEFGLKESKRIFGVQIGEFYGMVDTKQSETIPPIQSWKLKFSSNFFSMNPVLTKDSLLHVMRNNGNRCKRDSSETLSYHDFSSVEDPFRVCIKKLLARPREDLKNEPVDSNCAAIGCENGGYESGDSGEQGGDRGDILINKTESHYNHVETLTDVSGGSSWESLLGSSHKPVNDNALNHLSFTALFGMPLDFIIDKCLLQEIWLQYKYISKLTIKFLEEGFNFHEHLLALRRYHFMEVADWADLFIRSLWHQKWCMKVPDHRLSEIQGYLALSIQRSSCECDDNKNRLFVYVKEHSMMPLSRSVIGINSFEFLGLGYRVDWPISIILTPVALKIYADIFSFLIQVKLAAFALTDVWSSIKELAHFVGKNRHSEVHKWQAAHFDMFVKIRHQVNHFVCTLQHYVESHLSQESWCMFIQSIRHKVNDMMDLDSVHMAYLTDSLHICFLSEQTQLVGGIIKHILQCALDFRSCLAGGTWNVLLDQEDLLSKLSGINISQVLSIKQTFEKNLKELHFCYLKSPKHVNFGLSRFWELFNYNEYYNDVSDKTGCYGFLV